MILLTNEQIENGEAEGLSPVILPTEEGVTCTSNKDRSMNLNELVKQAHDIAKEKGWYEKSRTPLEMHMLIVSELAEATEEVRNPACDRHWYLDDHTRKPQGEAIELVDALIRIADYFGSKGWDLEELVKMKMQYNATRPHRHGGKAL